MSVKGNVRENTSSGTKYVGFVQVEVRAVNPTRAELNKLFGKEDADDDKEIEYTSVDQDGNDKVRLNFWLQDTDTQKFFIYGFNLINKPRKNKDGSKVQVINNTLGTTWVPLIEADESTAENRVYTDVADFSVLPNWFTHFIDRKTDDILGDKTVREALVGEEELATILKSWLGELNFSSPDADVSIDTKALFNDNFKELQELVDGEFSKPFVAVVGVRTDENDSTKQYQQVYGKMFLPTGFIDHFKKDFKGSSDFIKKAYDKFEKEIQGDYGFTSFYKLEPLTEYDANEDPAQAGEAQTTEPKTQVNSKF
jgi:hypothetical protein